MQITASSRRNATKMWCWEGQKKIRLPLNISWLGVLEGKLTASEDRGGGTASTGLERKGFKFGMESSTLSEEVNGSTQPSETENKTRHQKEMLEKQHADSGTHTHKKKEETTKKTLKMVRPKITSSLRLRSQFSFLIFAWIGSAHVECSHSWECTFPLKQHACSHFPFFLH